MSQPDLAAARAREWLLDDARRELTGRIGFAPREVSLAALLREVEQQAREQESLRCSTIAAYSINDQRDRDKTLARIREGHEQHTNRGGEPAPARERQP